MVVLWNTRYMNAAIDHLRKTGFDVRDDDLETVITIGTSSHQFCGEILLSDARGSEARAITAVFMTRNDPANLI